VSKTLQERAAWDYVKSLPESERFELVALNPSLLIGPNLNKDSENVAWLAVKQFFTGKTPPLNCKFSWVDVKDAARAHLLAVKVPEAAGKRFLLNGWTVWIPEMVEMYNKEFGP